MNDHDRDELLLDVRDRLVRIETKIEVLPDFEERLRKSERWRWGIPGSLLAALAALIGLSPHS